MPYTGLPPATIATYRAVGIEPFRSQLPILTSAARMKMIRGGQQSSKTTSLALDFLADYPFCVAEAEETGEESPIWLVAPSYNASRKLRQYIVRFAKAVGAFRRAYVDNSQPVIELEGNVVVNTYSGANPESIAGESPLRVYVDEAAGCSWDVIERCMARIEHRNGVLLMGGTYEKNVEPWFDQLAHQWAAGAYADRRSFKLPTWSNELRYPEGEKDPRILRMRDEMHPDTFALLIAGEAIQLKGVVVPEFRPDVHLSSQAEWIPGEFIYLGEDPGYGDCNHAILAMHLVGGQLRVFDEIALNRRIAEDAIEAVMHRPWWNPTLTRIASDGFYADRHHSQESVVETWRRVANVDVELQRLPLPESVMRFRHWFRMDAVTHSPRIIINPARCRLLCSELGAFPNPFTNGLLQWKYKVDHLGNVVGKAPEQKHNDACMGVIHAMNVFFPSLGAQGTVGSRLYTGGEKPWVVF